MVKNKDYGELLKDPRWQKKRLEIFERDGWRCVMCNAKDDTLHIHHRRYAGKPWEVDDNDLHTLCDDCHELFHGRHSAPDIDAILARREPPDPKEALRRELRLAEAKLERHKKTLEMARPDGPVSKIAPTFIAHTEAEIERIKRELGGDEPA